MMSEDVRLKMTWFSGHSALDVISGGACSAMLRKRTALLMIGSANSPPTAALVFRIVFQRRSQRTSEREAPGLT